MECFFHKCCKTLEDKDLLKVIPYTFAIGRLIYGMLYIRSDICFTVGIVSKYQSNLSMKHGTMIKLILKYLRRTKDYMLVYHCDKLSSLGYTDSNFQHNKDSQKFIFRFVFTLGGRAITLRSVMQSYDSIMEAKYVVASKATKKAI